MSGLIRKVQQALLTNTTAQRVPTSADITQTIPVSVAGTVNTNGNAVSYTNKYASTAPSAANTAIAMLAAGTNVNGAVLEDFGLSSNGPASATNFAIIAKATAPANVADGDVIYSDYMPTAAGKYTLDRSKVGAISVAAGMGIWYISTVIDAATLRSALFTVR